LKQQNFHSQDNTIEYIFISIEYQLLISTLRLEVLSN